MYSRHRRGRLCGAMFLSLALAGLVAATSATALELARPVSDAVMSRSAALATVGPDALAYYEKQFGVSEQVARYNLASQLMGQGVQEVLTDKYGEGITDVAFDNTTGQWVVEATSSVPGSGIASVLSADGLSEDYRVSHVNYTSSVLAHITTTLQSRLQSLTEQDIARVGYGGGGITVAVASNATQTDIEKLDSAETSLAASSSSSPHIENTTVAASSLYAVPTASCTFPYCASLIAGAFYYGDNAGCTDAWYSEATNPSGIVTPLMLTAGHCAVGMGGDYAPVYTQVPPSDTQVSPGFTILMALGEGGDWGSINPKMPLPSPLAPYPEGGYYNWAGGYSTALQYWYNNGWPAKGTIVCHQGYGSGVQLGQATQCGVVNVSTSIMVEVSGQKVTLNPMLEIEKTAACEGDSGGPWFLESANPTAVGIQSSATVGTINKNCGSTAWMTTTSEVNKIYNAIGYTFSLYE
jgi:hypothetical protein